jgi:two-component system, chemotaxis family, response regulator PixG
MTQGSSSIAEIEKEINPIKLLEQLATSQANGYLRVISHDIAWLLYFHEGKLFYASHSLEPIERIEQHFRRITQNQLAQQIYKDLREYFISIAADANYGCAEYQSIQWLVEQGHIREQDAGALVKGLTREVLQTYLLISQGQTEFTSQVFDCPMWWTGNFLFITKECQSELHTWQALQPAILSPYQRPYLKNVEHPALTPELKAKLSKILIGFSFRQLSLLLKQEELAVANNLHRLVVSGIVGLRPPQAPFHRFNGFYAPNSTNEGVAATLAAVAPPPPVAATPESQQQVYKIACVDDSPTILREINRFLDGDSFKVFPIVDSGTALMKIIRIDPDIILLDVGMPTIDGYKLCGMLRKHPAFKKIPIVMVTGNTGILDRAKAKMAGCTDYMTKPFTQSGLIEMVSKYLIAHEEDKN